jgi:hypothetical protein
MPWWLAPHTLPVGMRVEIVEKRPAVNRPWWVRATLWGLPNRASAMAFVWLLLAVAAAIAICGFWDRRYSVGAALVKAVGLVNNAALTPQFEGLIQNSVLLLTVASAIGYLLAIRWVDTHGGWS